MNQLSERDLQESVVVKMSRDFSRLRLNQTVGEALAAIRRQTIAGRIIYFYIVDDEDRLLGVIPTRRLLLSDPSTPVHEIMVTKVIAIPQTATVLEACEFFVMHRLLAFPIVDDQRRIIGVIDIEAYTEELNELDQSERSDDLFQLIGVHLAEAQQASPVVAYKLRFPWLLANIAGGILAAFLSGLFEAELQKVVAISLFIPVVLALAESVSIQSVSLALQILHAQPPTVRALLGKLRRELITGTLLGLSCAAAVALVAGLWLGDWRVVVCLLVGITTGVALSAGIGVAMPNVLRLLQRDPRVAAGPVALAMSDMVTLLVYFNCARLVLG